MNRGKKTLIGVVSGLAVAAAAVFFSKKENREKTKEVAKKAGAKIAVVAKKAAVQAKSARATAQKKAGSVKKLAQKKVQKIRKAVK